MCRLRNIAMRDYQESVTTGQTRKSDPYVPLCFAGDTKMSTLFLTFSSGKPKYCTTCHKKIHQIHQGEDKFNVFHLYM